MIYRSEYCCWTWYQDHLLHNESSQCAQQTCLYSSILYEDHVENCQDHQQNHQVYFWKVQQIRNWWLVPDFTPSSSLYSTGFGWKLCPLLSLLASENSFLFCKSKKKIYEPTEVALDNVFFSSHSCSLIQHSSNK